MLSVQLPEPPCTLEHALLTTVSPHTPARAWRCHTDKFILAHGGQFRPPLTACPVLVQSNRNNYICMVMPSHACMHPLC